MVRWWRSATPTNKLGGAIGAVLGTIGGNTGRQIGELAGKTFDQRAELHGNVTVTSQPQSCRHGGSHRDLSAQVNINDVSMSVARR